MRFHSLLAVTLCICLVGCQTNSNSAPQASQNGSRFFVQSDDTAKPVNLNMNELGEQQGRLTAKILAECMLDASKTYDVPPAVLVGIMHVEGGIVGKETQPDENGNSKIGVMNINSAILPELAEAWGLNTDSAHKKILNNGCANVRVAAWILAKKIQKAGTLIGGIAMYPSITDTQNNAYADRVLATMKEKGLIKEKSEPKTIAGEKSKTRNTKADPTVCGDMNAFFFVNNRPVKKCRYEGGRSLVAKQVTSIGILASMYGAPAGYDKFIFLFKNNDRDNDLADGDIIDSGTFEYMGPYSYQSLLGQRTVHSFRRVK